LRATLDGIEKESIMRQLPATAALIGSLMSAAAAEEATAPVKVTPVGSQASAAGPAAYFTGAVRQALNRGQFQTGVSSGIASRALP
jgi:hypothetical protein